MSSILTVLFFAEIVMRWVHTYGLPTRAKRDMMRRLHQKKHNDVMKFTSAFDDSIEDPDTYMFYMDSGILQLSGYSSFKS
jgi:hypothetical protein